MPLLLFDVQKKLKPGNYCPLIIIGLTFWLFTLGCKPAAAPSLPEPPSPSAIVNTISSPKPPQENQVGDFQIRAKDQMKMVFVPAGRFDMGTSAAEIAQAIQACKDLYGESENCQEDGFRISQPTHQVFLDAFWIDQTEVTNAQFAAFLNDQGNQAEEGIRWWEPGAGSRQIVYGYLDENDRGFEVRAGFENYPVVEISWWGAAAYCEWVGARLPTEAEWEFAARGPQSWVFPWGNDFDGSRVNYCDQLCTYEWKDIYFNDGAARWTVAGSYPEGASWCGALDLAGNVWEWVSDWWSEDYYSSSHSVNPQGPDQGTLRIVRGGSWFEESWRVSSSIRKALTPSSYRMHWVGFRCVLPLSP